MGDYCKLIVSCMAKPSVREELDKRLEELSLGDSAYQSQETIVSVTDSSWSQVRGRPLINLIIIGQTKWGDRQDEFCEWLRPHVEQGSGLNDVFAIQFSEYSDEPKLWKLGDTDPHGR